MLFKIQKNFKNWLRIEVLKHKKMDSQTLPRLSLAIKIVKLEFNWNLIEVNKNIYEPKVCAVSRTT
jgi:hypothetical protein